MRSVNFDNEVMSVSLGMLSRYNLVRLVNFDNAVMSES